MKNIIDTFPNGLMSQRLEMSPAEEAFVSRPRPDLYVHSIFGVKVVADESVPPGEMRVCQDNRVVARVVNIGQSTPTETEKPKQE